MKVFATFFTGDGFRREEILPELYPTYRLPVPSPVGSLWMTKIEHAHAMPIETREFFLESKKIIQNEYGITARAIYREKPSRRKSGKGI